MEEVEFWVLGEPAPKGSTKSFYIKKLGRTVTTAGNRNTKMWEQRVATEGQRMEMERAFYTNDKNVSYEVEMEFFFPRPRSIPKKRTEMCVRPDLDKLERAVLDGLTDVLIGDDARVVSIKSSKKYGSPPGAKIKIIKK